VTEDRGRLDATGYLHVLGRRDAFIITGGEKVDPAEIESVLRNSGEFSDVVVVGAADAEWGQAVVAAYPASSTPDLGKVGQVVNRDLTAHKRPKRYVPVADWPVNEQGKVNRERLLGLIESLKSRS
jgi:O-succinylbenzoic acid--CoA ligase